MRLIKIGDNYINIQDIKFIRYGTFWDAQAPSGDCYRIVYSQNCYLYVTKEEFEALKKYIFVIEEKEN